MPSEKISYERNGGGRLECRCAELWETGCGNSTDLASKRTARILLCLHDDHLVALHGFIKKTRRTPEEDLSLARQRKRELQR